MKRWAIVFGVLFTLGVAHADAPPASAPPIRFGFIQSISNNPLSQAAYVRYSRYLVDRFADAQAVTTVAIPVAGGAVPGSPDACRQLGLSGFLRPLRQWRMTAATVWVNARLVVTDCNGDVFFSGETTLEHERSTTMVPQDQIDGLSQKAADSDLAQFAAFVGAHRAVWNRLLTTGYMHAPAASS